MPPIPPRCQPSRGRRRSPWSLWTIGRGPIGRGRSDAPCAASAKRPSLAILLALLGTAMPSSAVEIPWAVVPETVDASAPSVAELVAADLDGDGDLDLAGATGTGAEIWFGAAGAWGAPSVLRAADPGRAVLAADFDHDGSTDLAFALDSGAYWFENGDGANGAFFGATTLPASTDVRGLALGDVDGDGDLDLVGALGGVSGAIRWWENAPPAALAPTPEGAASSSIDWTARFVASFAEASGVAVGDLDRDGDLDLVATADGATDDLVWFENTAGDGSTWTRRDVDTSFEAAHAPFVADLDHDGFLDLGAAGLAGIADPVLGLWLSDGTPTDGGWTADAETTSGPGLVRAADLDSDGDLDLAQASAGRLDWFENAGDGSTFVRWPVATPAGASAATVADFDHDGDLDLGASSQADEDVLIWPAKTLHRSGSFARERSLDQALGGGLGFDGARAVDAADLDGDGDLDLVAAAFVAGEVRWWRNDGDDFTPLVVDDAVPWAFGVRATDVDGDGDLDVLGALGRLDFNNGTNQLVWWENEAGVARRSVSWTRRTIASNINLTGGAADPWPIDMDRDGDVDVLLASAGTDRVAWWENTAGDGSAWSETSIVDPFGRVHSVAAADLDGDGDADVVAAADTGDEIAWWRNDGSGGGWTETSIITGWDGAYDVWVDDLDGDGDVDVLAASQFEDRISFWRNDGTGGFGSEETLGDPQLSAEGFFNQAYGVETGDLDGDGDVDIVGVAFKDGGKIAWWENDGGGATSWIRHDVLETFDGASSVHVADVDGDGRPDLVATAQVDDRLSLFYGGGGQFALATTSTAPADLGNNLTETLFSIELVPRGLASEGDVELVSIALLFEESPGDPLTTSELAQLLSSVELLVDDGSTPGMADGSDTVLASPGSPTLVDGVASLAVADGATAISQGTSETFFVRVSTTADFESQPLLGLQVTHLTEPAGASPGGAPSSQGEDREHDIPLLLEWQPNVSTPVFPVADQADLAVSIVPEGPKASRGQDFSWTVTVENLGPDSATGVELTLGLTGDAVLVSTAGCAEDPNGVPTCSLGTIGSGVAQQIVLEVSVDAMATGNLSLTVDASSDLPDPVEPNDSGSSVVPVGESADLGLAIVAASSTISAGSSASWTVTVVNAGPDPADSVVLDLSVLGEAGAISTSGCTEDPNGVPTCSLGTLAASSQAQVTVGVATADDAGGLLELAASASSATSDPAAGNNAASNSVTVVSNVDLSLDKTGPATFEPGIEVSYTITVTNSTGPGDTNAVVSDPFPSLEGVSWTCAATLGASCPASGMGPLAETVSLPAGGQVVFDATGQVAAGTTGALTNTASVAPVAGSQDSNPANDQDSTTAQWLGLFADGFESGSTGGWSSATP